MSKNLVIVESPAKAKTIEKYLGKDYSVKSSFGHIRDLPKKGLSIDKDHGFEPTYEISPEKKKTVAELKRAVKVADTVWLASDEDREGEAIAWHLCEALKLDPKKTKIIVFHEITKPAILAAIEKPRTVDAHLVDAQQARRVLDRLVGYELSPVLWKKVRAGLSAGRVQSVAVRLIVEREREIKAHEAAGSFKVTAIFNVANTELKAELPTKFDTHEQAKKFLNDVAQATFTIDAIEQKPGTKSPGAPFTTSTLQQEAARKLGYSVRQTMSVAQRLYESGQITYMRTDSTNLSQLAIDAAKSYITSQFGAEYHNSRQFKTKSASAQEAHEAIRPTDFTKVKAGQDGQQEKLYKLIWQRALASQMAAAKVEKTEIHILPSTRKEKLLAKGEVVIFDGYLKVYGGGKDDVLLPEVEKGQKLDLNSMQASEVFSKPPARYSEASLVRKLEEMGIGRPSTYAPTISVIQDRGYIEKGDLDGEERTVRLIQLKKGTVTESTDTERFGSDRGKLIPTSTADVVTDFLTEYFGPVVDYDFTKNVEEEFDRIADGKQKWNKMIAEFYKDFVPLIAKTADVSRKETSQMRKIGEDKKSGAPIFVRIGRYGPMVQVGEATDDEKPTFYSLPKGTNVDTVTLEEAEKAMELPRTVGKTDKGVEIEANVGRFGPYVKVDKLYVSIKDYDPRTISLKEALALIAEKEKKEREKHIQSFEGSTIQVLNGPYGPYITDGKKNAKIPKDKEPKKLTLEECEKLLAEAPAKKRFPRRKKS